MSICSLVLLLAAAIYAAGGVLARRGPDYREETQHCDDGNVQDSSEETGQLPLLQAEEVDQSPSSHDQHV